MAKKYILGINAAYHEPSACITENGKVVAAVEEERFNRIKHGKKALIDNPDQLPFNAIDACLRIAGIKPSSLSCAAFSFDPIQRLIRNVGLEKNVIEGDWGSDSGERTFYNKLMKCAQLMEEHYSIDLKGKWHWIPHQISHAASAFYPSGFSRSAILTTDGIGEFGSTLLAYGEGNTIKVIEETGNYPNSLGFLWTKASSFLHFLVNGTGEYGAGTVMALASYGNPDRFYKTFRTFVNYNESSKLQMKPEILQFRSGTHEKYEKLFGFRARQEGEPVRQEHMDFAAALQRINDEVILGLSNRLYAETKCDKLCRAGGVALNCTTNSALLKKGPYKNIYIFPGANDMGTAVGAALYTYHHICGGVDRNPITSPYAGPHYTESEIEIAIKSKPGIEYRKLDDIEAVTASLIEKGAVVGWFQGRMEFGPRALGNRSIVGDPRRGDILKRISQDIKGREWFRPLAPSVLERHVDKWFVRYRNHSESDKWMLFSYKVRPKKMGQIPAVTHYDGTGRVQVVNERSNSRLYKLIHEFYLLTGVPMIINTSFNIREPIVCTPQHAIDTFLKSGNNGIDFLVMGDFMVSRIGEPSKKPRLLCMRASGARQTCSGRCLTS
jgi:carbamoyltransferase